MKETVLQYYYPFWIDRKHNFRGFKENQKLLEKIKPKYVNNRIVNFENREAELAINNYIEWEYYHW